jgi:ABC-type branched-chain amino acid transport system, permease component
MLLCRNLLDSRKGRAIRSLRGGIAMVESLAIDSFRMRLAIFASPERSQVCRAGFMRICNAT